MPLNFRWTAGGKAKQVQDELEGWKLIRQACEGTGSQVAVDAVVSAWLGAVPTAINTQHANYAPWQAAHKRATLRARLERQRLQHVAALGLPAAGVASPHQRNPATVAHQTLRIAILCEATSTANGTTVAGQNRRTTAQLMTRLDDVLSNIEATLAVRAQNREDHDLRALGVRPIQVFIGPEWYFRQYDRPYTQVERDAIVQQLQDLSRRFPDWLLMPGTIYWTPDNLPAATLRVFNQAVILYAGNVVATRTKRNPQDIDNNQAYKERWGPDSALGLPASVPAATLQVAHLLHPPAPQPGGREWCFDICRDHPAGEAMSHYVNNAGADIYVLTSNGTTIRDNFIPTRNNGVAIYCDGGANLKATYTITRPTALNNGGLVGHWNNYWVAFPAERVGSVAMFEALSERDRCQKDPNYQSFMVRFNAVFAAPSSDAALEAAAMLAVGAAFVPPTPLGGQMFMDRARLIREERVKIQHVLAHGTVPTGTPITPAENNIMTQYATACTNAEAGLLTIATNRQTVENAKQTFENTSSATKAAAGNQVAMPAYPTLALYNLINAP